MHLGESQRFVEPELASKWMPNRLSSGDVLLTSEAPLGEAAYLAEPLHVCLGQRLFGLRARKDVLDGRFLYFMLQSPSVQHRLRARASGTTAQGIKQSELREVCVDLPPLIEQRWIAETLGVFDDKIDSNRRLATTLAESGQCLFEGMLVRPSSFRPRKQSKDVQWPTAQLSELVSPYREAVEIDPTRPYIGLAEMPPGSTVLTKWLTDNAPQGRGNRFDRGDILFGKLRPYFRKVGVAPIDGRCSTEILVLRPHDERYWGFALGYIASQAFIDHCNSVSRGTKMPRAEWKDAGSFLVSVPPPSVAGQFSDTARILYTKIQALVMESRTLNTLRDALLPKLISGKIRVPDASDPEEAMGTVAKQAAT